MGSRAGEVLPADNGRPDRFVLIDTVRRASAALNLKAPVIATLDALLSCLPPRRNHNVVFASNATLAFKRNGISDRTLRRHIEQLVEVGFVRRSDSPNGKRFSKSDMSTGSILRFGFDLEPLFMAYDQMCALADDCAKQASHLSYLRTKLRTAIARTLERDGPSDRLDAAQRALRRKLTADEISAVLESLVKVADFPACDAHERVGTAPEMTVTGGQNDRHLQSSKKEYLDSDGTETTARQATQAEAVSLPHLMNACREAMSYIHQPPTGPSDVICHARTLAPMMGIDRITYHAAEDRLGELGTAVAVWGLLEMQGKIRQLGAYFRAVTSGKRSMAFNPWTLISRLAKQKMQVCC